MLKRGRGYKTPPDVVNRVRKLLTETDLSPQKIGQESGCSRWTVRQIHSQLLESAKNQAQEQEA